ncbi:MAG: hypothetical protein AB1414_18575 [bacterium]
MAHCGKRKDNILSSDFPPAGVVIDWLGWLREGGKQEDIDILKRNTQKGLPTGRESFILELEKVMNRSLKFRLPGKPRKVEEKDE